MYRPQHEEAAVAERPRPPASEVDREYLRCPGKVLSPLILTLRTFGATADPSVFVHKEFVDRVEPRGLVVAVESNFGHKCTPAYKKPLKTAKQPKPGRSQRTQQGDGSCFGSAIEARIDLELDPDLHPEIRKLLTIRNRTLPKKDPYSVRYFPKSGELQVAGSLSHDCADAQTAARHWAAFLTDQRACGVDDAGAPLVAGITRERINMMNHKFAVTFDAHPARLRLLLKTIADIFLRIAATKAPTTMGGATFALVREINSPNGRRNGMSFRVYVGGETKEHRALVKIFLRGKINIAGAKRPETAEVVYRYMTAFFRERWYDVVDIEPVPDPDSDDSTDDDDDDEAGAATGAPRGAASAQGPCGQAAQEIRSELRGQPAHALPACRALSAAMGGGRLASALLDSAAQEASWSEATLTAAEVAAEAAAEAAVKVFGTHDEETLTAAEHEAIAFRHEEVRLTLKNAVGDHEEAFQMHMAAAERAAAAEAAAAPVAKAEAAAVPAAEAETVTADDLAQFYELLGL